jgi:predicted site-specific integrase-resolvase
VNNLININQAAQMLGVDITTLRYWDKTDKLKPQRTMGGHRRYLLSDIKKLQGIQIEPTPDNAELSKQVAVYARVSSHEQKGDLKRQKGRLLEYCVKKKYEVRYIFEEVGSGMSDTRAKLSRLCDVAEKKDVSKVIIEHKDRLTRFNYRLYERYFKNLGVEVIIVEETLPKSYEAELVEDIMSLVASSSSKIYEKRSAENRRKKITNNIKGVLK